MSRLLAAILLALGTTAASAATVYDTFNEGDQANLFDCCNALPIIGPHAGEAASVAVPFTPETFAKIVEIDIGAYRESVDPLIQISIYGSTNGLPGPLKKAWKHVSLPLGEQCFIFAAVDSSNNPVHAAAGGHYWIAIEGKKHAVGGWNLNSIGASGPYAVRGEDGVWTMTEGQLPAVRIIGR